VTGIAAKAFDVCDPSSSVMAKKPFTPSFTTSQFIPTGEATTGLLAAMYCTSL